MSNFFDSGLKSDCFGCEACVQVCPVGAITMKRDSEKFRYPEIDSAKCINCSACRRVCQSQKEISENTHEKYAFGGHIKDSVVLNESTSGGAFSAIAESWCKENYVIFGAQTDGLSVKHSYITDKKELAKFRRSKYTQSVIGSAYSDAEKFLKEGRNVLFSGTPCQISALNAFLKNKKYDNLLTVEVICEGVPSPLYIDKFAEYLKDKHGSDVESIDYRFKNRNKWDFEAMQVAFADGRTRKKDRWFNDFWVIWLNHLMSRPSCYKCPFTTTERSADISLGDLWGVHLYCPELYYRNRGASLIVCSTEKGENAVREAEKLLDGHELKFTDALKYQSPMRKAISENPKRDEFMEDLKSDKKYEEIIETWSSRPSFKLLWSKYVWGNRQKVFVWNIKNKLGKG